FPEKLNTSIKAVVFDLDGVYFGSGTNNFFDALFQKYGLNRDQVVEVYFKSDQMQEYKSGKISGEDYWNYAISHWGIQAKQSDLIELLINSYSVNPLIDKYIEKLQSKGIKTAVCTNNFPERLENLMKRFKLHEKFDVIVASYQVGVTKPDTRIFKTLAKRLGLNPHEILMSDDIEA